MTAAWNVTGSDQFRLRVETKQSRRDGFAIPLAVFIFPVTDRYVAAD